MGLEWERTGNSLGIGWECFETMILSNYRGENRLGMWESLGIGGDDWGVKTVD